MQTGLPSPIEPSDSNALAHSGAPAPLAGYAPEPPGERGAGGRNGLVKRLGAILLRFKWLVPIPILLGVGAGVVASRYVAPQYAAQATIWIESPTRGDGGGPIRSGELLQEKAWIELLRSYAVLDAVVRDERLYLEYPVPGDSAAFAGFTLKERFRPGEYRLQVDKAGARFRLTTREGVTVQEGAVGDSVGTELGFAWVPRRGALRRDAPIAFTVTTPRDAAIQLGNRLGTVMPRGGNFLRIELAGSDPERITSAVNTLTDNYVRVAGELKRAQIKEREEILAEQLGRAAAGLQAEEAALEGFRVRTITLPTDRGSPINPGLAATQNPVFDNYFSLNLELDQVRRDREAIEQALGGAAAGRIAVSALEVIPAVRSSTPLMQALQELVTRRAELRALSAEFTENYAPLQRLAAQVEALERRTIPTLAAGVMAELAQREASLSSLIDSASYKLREIPPRAIEEARLQRRVEIAENLYTTLEQRYEEARLSSATSVPDIRVLDPATVPFSPTEDPRLKVILIFSLGGVGMVVGAAFLFDRLNPRLAYPEQVTDELGLPILGAIPYARPAAAQRATDAHQLPEAFRGLRLAVVHASGAAGPLTLTITSPSSGDGKSFVSANLALTFAAQGQRTLLIDGDLRRGSLHRLLGCSRKPGLLDYLGGAATRSEIVQATRYPNLHFIGVGSRSGVGPELLGTSAMAELLAQLRSSYGVILIDSPPMSACVDPLVLSTLTRDMLLVLRTDATSRQLTEWNLQAVDRLPVRVLGAVVNGISPRGVYRAYAYAEGYEYAALPEGGDSDDSSDSERLLTPA